MDVPMATETRDDMRGMVWITCSAAQLASALLLFKRGHGASSMPFRAFSIASLGLGSATCGVGAALHSAGIRRLDDVKEIGKSLRHSLRRDGIDAVDSQRSK